MIDCKCEKCGVDYTKPDYFKEWNEQFPNIFFRWSLIFCDKCRREKEREALKYLPKIIDQLSKKQNNDERQTNR